MWTSSWKQINNAILNLQYAITPVCAFHLFYVVLSNYWSRGHVSYINDLVLKDSSPVGATWYSKIYFVCVIIHDWIIFLCLFVSWKFRFMSKTFRRIWQSLWMHLLYCLFQTPVKTSIYVPKLVHKAGHVLEKYHPATFI